MFIEYRNPKIISLTLIEENNTIEVITRIPSNSMLLSNPPKPSPDEVYKEIYGIIDKETGKIGLINRIKGEHTPARTIDEQIKFY